MNLCGHKLGARRLHRSLCLFAQHDVRRFWPSRVLRPDEHPESLGAQQLPGQFVVEFLGSHDHAWVSHLNLVSWTNNDDKSRFASGRNRPVFTRAVEEAIALAEERRKERVRLLCGLCRKGAANLLLPLLFFSLLLLPCGNF